MTPQVTTRLLWTSALALSLTLAACQNSSPTAPTATNDPSAPLPAGPMLSGDAVFPLGVTQHDATTSSGNGVLGAWQVTVARSGEVAMEPVQTRSTTALGDQYLVNIAEYMGGAFCPDCVRPAGFGVPDPTNPNIVEVIFEARHPIPLPPESENPGPGDRLDLHVHDVQAIVVAEGNKVYNTKAKVVRGESIVRNPVQLNPSLLINADGFTSQLDPDIDNFFLTGANVHPYKILFENDGNGNYDPAVAPLNGYPDLRNPTGHNVMPMGAGYRKTPFQFYIPTNGEREFLMVVSCAYGISAQGKGTDIGKRMNPRYFLPLFNLKEAWKVKCEVTNNELAGAAVSSTADLTINVWDWQQQAQVDPNFSGGSSNLARLDRASKLRSVEVDIPDLGFAKFLSASDFTGTGQGNNPLTTTITLNNASLAAGGNYWGLVAVRDDLEGTETGVRAFGKDLQTLYALRDFSTYQTFLLEVAPADNPPNAVIVTTPAPPIVDSNVNIHFDGSSSTDDGAITAYYWDFHYSGNAGDFTVEATGPMADFAYVNPGDYQVALVVVDDNDPPQQSLASVPVTINCPTSTPATCLVEATPSYGGFSVNTGWSLANGKLDVAFLSNSRLVFEDNKVLVTSPVTEGSATAVTPLIPGYPGQWVGSIDVDRQDRIVWVGWEETLDPLGDTITSLEIGPLNDKLAGMDQYVNVLEFQTGSNQWIEVASIDMGEAVHAIDTDEQDNIWVITASHKLKKISDDLTMTSFEVDLDVAANKAPSFVIGEVFDMAIDFYSHCFLVLTDGLEAGTIDVDPDYRGGPYARVWRFECDGSYTTTTPSGSPNPVEDLLIIPPTGYPFFNLLGFDALADIEVDNFGGAGWGTPLAGGTQNCQVLIAGSGLVAGEGIRVSTTMARLNSDLDQASSVIYQNTVGLRAFAIRPDGGNQVVSIGGDTNATQVLEYYNIFGTWQ